IGTQDIMFRTGMVSPPGGAEREIEGGAKSTKTDAAPKPTGGGGKPTGKPAGKSTTAPKNTNGSNGNGKGTANGKRPATGKKPSSSNKAASNGQASNGSTEDEVAPAAKPHPRSRSKK